MHRKLSHKHSTTAFSTGSEAKLLITTSWSFWCWLNCCLGGEASSKKYIIGHTFQYNLDITDSDSYSPHWNRNLQDGICFFLMPFIFLLGGWSYAMLVYLQTHDTMLRDRRKQYHFREWSKETQLRLRFNCHWSSFALRIKCWQLKSRFVMKTLPPFPLCQFPMPPLQENLGTWPTEWKWDRGATQDRVTDTGYEVRNEGVWQSPHS